MLGPRFEGNGWGSPGWVEMFQFDAEGGPVAVPWIGRDTPQDAGFASRISDGVSKRFCSVRWQPSGSAFG